MWLYKIKIICLIFFPITALLAQELTIDFRKQEQFANELYSKKEFYRAITEYQRLLHFFPQSEKQKIHLQIIKSYMAGKNYDEAISYIEKLEKTQPNLLEDDSISFFYSLALLEKDKHRIFYYRQDHIEKSIRIMQSISTDFEKPITDFLAEWNTTEETLPQKSPWLAGSLSAVLPGAGSVYNERYKEAFYSFFIIGLFAFASIEANNENQAEQEAFFSFFTLAFYGGNIYTAVNGAHKYNEYEKSNALEQLQRKYNIQFQY
jgi:outer membrane protein assembly factor BamD (BamD/ComL family)